MPGIGKVQRRLNPGYTTTDNQGNISHRYFHLLLRLEKSSPGYRHLNNICSFLSSRLAVIEVNPTTMFPDVSHFQQIRVKPNLSDALTEGGLVKPWGARSYDYAVQSVFIDVPFDFYLTGVSAGIPISHRNSHARKLFCRPPYLFSISRPGNVEPAIANKDTYPEFIFSQLAYLLVE